MGWNRSLLIILLIKGGLNIDNKRLKDMLTFEERAKVDLYMIKIDHAQSIIAAKFYGWRARAILDKVIKRIR